jgi:hypothetical protein
MLVKIRQWTQQEDGMAQLSSFFQSISRTITDDQWKMWSAWYARILFFLFPKLWNDMVLVILDGDGKVHLRQWIPREKEDSVDWLLNAWQSVFCVHAISGKIVCYSGDTPFAFGRFTFLKDIPTMRIRKDTFAAGFEGVFYEMTWPELGEIHELAALSEFIRSAQMLLLRMPSVIQGRGTHLLVEALISSLRQLDEFRRRERDAGDRQIELLKSMRAESDLAMKKAVVEKLQQLVTRLEGAPGSRTHEALKNRLIVLESLLEAVSEAPEYFKIALAEYEAKLVECRRLIGLRAANRRPKR